MFSYSLISRMVRRLRILTTGNAPSGWYYLISATTVAISAVVRWMLNPYLGDEEPFLLFMPAIMLSAWVGGWGPGLLATLLSALLGTYFWVGPQTLWIYNWNEAVHVLVCVTVGSAISAMSYALRVAQKAAEMANQSKDQFIAVLSHELRQPMAPMTSAVENLQQDAGLAADARADVEIIRRNIDIQTRFIEDLLDVNRIASGKMHLERSICDLHEVIHHAIEACRPDLENKQLILAESLTASAPLVDGDPLRLQQVFWNLLRNAIKFTPAGGHISIRSANVGSSLQIQVQDDGIGIEPEQLSLLFQKYQQAHGGLSTQLGGLGLGLSICKGVIQLHGGRIEAASAGRQSGSTFTVTLPAACPGITAAPVLTSAKPVTTNRPRILLVDDQPEAVHLLKRLLERAGYQVRIAQNMQSALQAAEEPFDLLISDLALPDGSGQDLLRQLRMRGEVRAICLSGFAGEEDVHRSLAAGFQRHLAKPVAIQSLREAIDAVLHSTSNP